MKDHKKRYWKGLEELSNDPEFVKYADKEFPEHLPVAMNSEGNSRRDFLKLMGFSLAAASLAACEAPVKKAIPYVNKPVDIDPGIPNFYASTFTNGGDYCSIVVKTREGRPIFIEGNDLSSISQGKVNAQVQASVLSLYDINRLKGPYANQKEIGWEALDNAVIKQLSAISSAGGQIRIISNTILSPSTKAVIEQFRTRFPGTEHIQYDQNSAYGIKKANEASFGRAVIPTYNFTLAKVIVSFSADFLGTWIAPIEFNRQYNRTRKIGPDKKEMSQHYQYEANLSMTGANADYRIPVKPSQEGLVVAQLYNLIAASKGATPVSVAKLDKIPFLEKVAAKLLANQGQSLVVAGTNDISVQILVNAINSMLGNYGTTINLDLPVNYRQGDDVAMYNFIQDVERGIIDGVIFLNSNPVYDHPLGAVLTKNMAKIKLKIATNERMDETASLVNYVAPDHHYLESWNDAEPKPGFYSLAQPAITPLFKTRQAQETLLKWSGATDINYYNFLQSEWRNKYMPLQAGASDFQLFWDENLYKGVLEVNTVPSGGSVVFTGNIAEAASAINKFYKANNNEIELVLYEKVGVGNGSMANNPWLQELPDPVTKTSWDNYLTISKAMANELGVNPVEGNSFIVNLIVGEKTLPIPALVQPGQARGTVGLAIGYGRERAGKVADTVGINAYPLAQFRNGSLQFSIISGVKVAGTNAHYKVAQTQTQQTYMGRETVIQEATLAEYKEDPTAGRYMPRIQTKEGAVDPVKITLWHGHQYPDHHWAMAIDLNSCTGCGTCTVACNSENNVPVVGREEVINRRDMLWMRIDRYYSSNADPDDNKGLEIAAENPEVVFQPMLCQHCNNAPCETVCPVAATTHSSDGLNQMAYNRCIGTRYCANNCPYKVRRFNWFKYHDNQKFKDTNVTMNSDLGKMVLNPDVTVRARGVMEKCTFCIQRIQAGKLQAKKENRRPLDGEIVTACAKACPADAIFFGDINNPDSLVSKILNIKKEGNLVISEQPRAYSVLHEINTRPNIFYLTKIRNKDKEENLA